MSVLFFTQLQQTLKIPMHIEWENVCCGHTSFHEAMICYDLLSATMNGKLDSTILVDPIIHDIIKEMSRLARDAGTTFRFRLVKRTEEVIDA